MTSITRNDVLNLKVELKTWEKEFFSKWNRSPESSDVKKEPDIAKKYSMYRKLKKALDREQKGQDTVSDKENTPMNNSTSTSELTKLNVAKKVTLPSFQPIAFVTDAAMLKHTQKIPPTVETGQNSRKRKIFDQRDLFESSKSKLQRNNVSKMDATTTHITTTASTLFPMQHSNFSETESRNTAPVKNDAPSVFDHSLDKQVEVVTRNQHSDIEESDTEESHHRGTLFASFRNPSFTSQNSPKVPIENKEDSGYGNLDHIKGMLSSKLSRYDSYSARSDEEADSTDDESILPTNYPTSATKLFRRTTSITFDSLLSFSQTDEFREEMANELSDDAREEQALPESLADDSPSLGELNVVQEAVKKPRKKPSVQAKYNLVSENFVRSNLRGKYKSKSSKSRTPKMKFPKNSASSKPRPKAPKSSNTQTCDIDNPYNEALKVELDTETIKSSAQATPSDDDFEIEIVDNDPSNYFASSVDATTCQVDSNFLKTEDTPSPKDVHVNVQQILKSIWGFETFREGQLETIRRILDCQSTLLISSTGSGKSLCYQIPAYVLSQVARPSITLVISPMISLMQDQVRCLPPELPGACLTSAQESSDQKKIINRILGNQIRILFISPEKLQSENFQNLLKSERFPRILLACVDEAHCLSEWSHNFRPSYLKVNSILKEKLKVPCLLAMTGTATYSTRSSICEMLEIDTESGVISGPLVRNNLKLSVSVEKNREVALINLLNSEPFRSLNSIIIYVMRQNQADLLASQLRVRNFQADSYHAGKPASQRKNTQSNFMAGKLRILVATIAFGLGLNKLDVRSVIHFNLPKSMENYVQEIGRSGRDGLPSYCHMFVDQEDFMKLRSLAYSDSVDEISIRRLLFKVFPNSLKTASSKTESSEMAKGWTLSKPQQLCLSMDGLETELDVKREVLETLLSYLNMLPDPPLRMLPSTYAKCNLGFYKPPSEKIFQEFPFLETIIKQAKKTRTSYMFEPIKICEMLDMSFQDLRGQLYRLQHRKEGYFELIEPSFYLELLRFPFKEDVDDEFIDSLKSSLFSRSKFQEFTKLMQVDQVYHIMNSIVSQDSLKASYATVDETGERMEILREKHSEVLQKSIGQYFTESTQLIQNQDSHPSYVPPKTIQDLIADLADNNNNIEQQLQSFIEQHSEFITSARAVTRIFHAIPSPQFTTTQWCRGACWGKYVDYDFERLMKLAQKILLEVKMKGLI